MIVNTLFVAYPEDFVWISSWVQSRTDDILDPKAILHPNRSLPEPFKEVTGCQKYCGRNQECMGCFRKYEKAYTWNAIEGNEIGKLNLENKLLSMKPG